ncbi:MAG: radical SAM protein [Candidatus Hodarchaeaceae archaeon]|nr:radical SAM protein [Candidatus Hodarchaeaceae archaeon]
MSVEYSSITCKTALSPCKLPGLRYSLNPYVGCEHGCKYCYSPSTLRDEWMGLNWGKFVRAKQNIAEVLAREVKRKPKGTVGVSTVCDPYQPLEAKLELTRKCIEMLSKHDFPVSIQTKSRLVLRDADLIDPEKFDVGVTITTMDRGMAGLLEPGAPPPNVRAQVLEEFSSRGVETWLFLGPIIPGLNDAEENLKQIIEVAARTKSKVIYDRLNLKQWVMGRLGSVLEQERPGLAERLPALVREGSEPWRQICSKVETICGELGVKCETAFPSWPSAQ